MIKKAKEMTNWIERKDLTYWLIIIVLLWLLSSDFGKKNTVVLDNWNFTGTIVSIILAVLAIVYTYAQGSTTLMTTKKLEESADKIEVVSTKLKEISLDVLFNELESKIGGIVTKIDLSVKGELQKHKEFIEGILDSTKTIDSPFEKSFEILTKDSWDKYIQDIFKEPHPIRDVLYLVYKYNEMGVSFNFSQYAFWIGNSDNNKTDEQKEDLTTYVIAVLTSISYVFESLNIYRLEDNDNKKKVVGMSPVFHKSMNEFISSNAKEVNLRSLIRFFEEKYPDN